MAMDKRYRHNREDSNQEERFRDNAVNRRLREDVKRQRRRKTSFWLLLGVGVLILLLLVWITIASFWGDTDVAADFIAPYSALF